MQYKTYKRISHSWYAVALGNPPIYYVQQCESESESESDVIEIVIGPIYKISTDPDFTRYHVISDYMLRKHFIPALYNNIFMKV